MGKIPHESLVALPLVTHGEFYFSPFVASPLMGKNPIPSPYPSFNSSLIHIQLECLNAGVQVNSFNLVNDLYLYLANCFPTFL